MIRHIPSLCLFAGAWIAASIAAAAVWAAMRVPGPEAAATAAAVATTAACAAAALFGIGAALW